MSRFLVNSIERPPFLLGSVYNSDSYNSSTYNGASTTTGQTSGSNAGGVLSNTGFDLTLIVTIACVLLFLAVIVRIWKRPRHATTLND